MRGIRKARSKLVLSVAAPAALIAGYLFAVPAQSQAMPAVPCKDPRGCPDLTVNQDRLKHSKLETNTFSAGDCAVEEGLVGGTGSRRLFVFTYNSPNMGPGSLIIGDPGAPENSNIFEWALCHQHYHFTKYAAYRLWKPADFTRFQELKAQNPTMLSADIIANNGLNPVLGTKRGFCVIDVSKAKAYQGTPDQQKYTNCGSQTIAGNQGISVGWADEYKSKLDGQWIDVTGVAAGDYILDVETNPDHLFEEARYDNNSASMPVKVTQ